MRARSFCRWISVAGWCRGVGMFLWVRVEWPERCSAVSVLAIEERIVERALRRGVQVTKGSLFDTRQQGTESALYLRLTYAAAEVSEFCEGVNRLGATLEEELDPFVAV